MIALKLTVNKSVRCLKKVNMLDSKKYEKKMKSPFMIYVDFESTFVLEDNGKQNPDESHRRVLYEQFSKKRSFEGFFYKLVCVDDKFSKLFEPYLGEYVV